MSAPLDLSELTSFDKNTLKKAETNEQNALPDEDVLAEEKAQAGHTATAQA